MTEEELAQDGFGNMTGQKIIQAGFKKGFKRGTEEAPRALLLQLLRKRFGGAVDAAIEGRRCAASAPQIERWLDRVVSSSLVEVLAD